MCEPVPDATCCKYRWVIIALFSIREFLSFWFLVFTGGTNNIVTWIDSDAVPGPSLSQLGRLQIDMWVDDVVSQDDPSFTE